MREGSTKGTVQISNEKEFVYRESFNKGYSHVPNMIVSCIGLSSNAKSVYNFICSHVFEGGHTAFPSVYRIAFACGATVKSVINYINELVDKGLITKESQGNGRSNKYTIVEYHQVPLLKVSEMLWSIFNDLQKKYSWRDVLPAKDKLIKLLGDKDIRLQDLPIDRATKEDIEKAVITLIRGGEVDMSFLPKNRKLILNEGGASGSDKPHPKHFNPNPRPINEADNLLEKDATSNHYRRVDIDEWSINHFKEFYYDLYLDVTGHVHPRNKSKHAGIVGRVLKLLNNDKATLKLYMETAFKIGYDVVTLEYFCTSTRLGEIQTFLTNGTKPFYLTKGKTTNQLEKRTDGNPTQYRGMSRKKLNDLLEGDD